MWQVQKGPPDVPNPALLSLHWPLPQGRSLPSQTRSCPDFSKRRLSQSRQLGSAASCRPLLTLPPCPPSAQSVFTVRIGHPAPADGASRAACAAPCPLPRAGVCGIPAPHPQPSDCSSVSRPDRRAGPRFSLRASALPLVGHTRGHLPARLFLASHLPLPPASLQLCERRDGLFRSLPPKQQVCNAERREEHPSLLPHALSTQPRTSEGSTPDTREEKELSPTCLNTTSCSDASGTDPGYNCTYSSLAVPEAALPGRLLG